jgi:hypothetical protein
VYVCMRGCACMRECVLLMTQVTRVHAHLLATTCMRWGWIWPQDMLRCLEALVVLVRGPVCVHG